MSTPTPGTTPSAGTSRPPTSARPPTVSPTTPFPSSPSITGTTTSALPAPVAQPNAPSNLVITGLLSGAVLAALLSACIAVWGARRKSREEERACQRDLFARAFEAYAAYKELPYAIRRRRHDEPAAERVRLSEVGREIQGRLSYYLAWTAAESDAVGNAYAALVGELRKVAGAAMRQAWQDPPIHDDHKMNIPPEIIDLSALRPLEEAYTRAVRAHLQALSPWWAK